MDHRKDPDTIPAQVSMRFGAQDEKNMSLALSQALLALKEGEIPVGCAKEEALAIAKQSDRIAALLEGKTLVKEIYVPGKIINFVVK